MLPQKHSDREASIPGSESKKSVTAALTSALPPAEASRGQQSQGPLSGDRTRSGHVLSQCILTSSRSPSWLSAPSPALRTALAAGNQVAEPKTTEELLGCLGATQTLACSVISPGEGSLLPPEALTLLSSAGLGAGPGGHLQALLSRTAPSPFFTSLGLLCPHLPWLERTGVACFPDV